MRMGDLTNKMGLSTWDQPLDRYDYFQLSNNWQIVDFHDHSPGRGVQIPRGGIAPGAVGPTQLGADIPWVPSRGILATRPAAGTFGREYYATDTNQWFMDNGNAWQTLHGNNGAVNIPTSESRTNTAYGTLTTPDQVTGIVLPTNGLLRVWYQATWQESVSGGGRAAIFIGANQLSIPSFNGLPAAQAAILQANLGPNTNSPLMTSPIGLLSKPEATAYAGDVTTGQALGFVAFTGEVVRYEIAGNVETLATPSSTFAPAFGGACEIFAAAGTYTVSVQFKASSGSVTSSNRKLWVQALDFSG